MLFVEIREAITSRHWVLSQVGVALALSLSVSAKSFAAARDYKFELAAPVAKTDTDVLVKIRLIHVSDGKAVAGALVFETKFGMSAEGNMAAMTAPITAVPSADPAIYQFEVHPSEPGNWAIEFAAKIQGEGETVRGSVNISVPK
jgi:hypothetical protein